MCFKAAQGDDILDCVQVKVWTPDHIFQQVRAFICHASALCIVTKALHAQQCFHSCTLLFQMPASNIRCHFSAYSYPLLIAYLLYSSFS